MTNDQLYAVVNTTLHTAGDVLGAVFTLCTVIGNALSRVSNERLSTAGHVVLAFGADVAKAKKRISELFSSEEK